MKKVLIALLLALSLTSLAEAKVNVQDGKFWFNGVRQEMVWGRSCFKLANHVTHHFKGQGGGFYGLGSGETWIRFHMDDQPFEFRGEVVTPLGLPDGFVCRVFLENGGWSPCETGPEINDGKPESCMFGSEPRDLGFWDDSGWDPVQKRSGRDRLRDGSRETEMHGAGKQVLEWFYQMSEKHGMAFELVIDATLKHDDIPKGEIDHVIRVTAAYAGEVLEPKYPNALVFFNYRNEWNAHNESGHTLAEVNMWAVRTYRDQYFPFNRTPILVDGGGANSFEYDVGPEDGKYSAAMIHPERGSGWNTFPQPQDMIRLRRDARGMPVGANESMYYISAKDTESWYRPGGRTLDWPMFEGFLNYQLNINQDRDGYDYFIVHDDKGAETIWNWPRARTEVDDWLANNIGTGVSPEPPPGPEPPPTPEPPIPIVVKTGCDDSGSCTYVVNVPDQPHLISGGSESFVWSESFNFSLPEVQHCTQARTFIGLNDGDRGEFDVYLYTRSNFHVLARSLHRHRGQDFESWWPHYIDVTAKDFMLVVLGRVTGTNTGEFVEYRGQLKAEMHVGFVMQCQGR